VKLASPSKAGQAMKGEVYERREYVYAVGPELGERFADAVSEHLRVDVYRPQLGVSAPAHYVTTLYFDSARREIARACESGVDNVKLRAREYCDRSDEHGVWREPLLWLEVKARTGARTRKLRFGIPKGDVPPLLTRGLITPRMIEQQRARWDASAEALLAEIAVLCSKTKGPLRPDCLAHYRRWAWQDEAGDTRVTLDTELAFCRPPPALFRDITSLGEAVAGSQVIQAEEAIIEIKLRGECPAWLRELLRETGLEPAVSDGVPYSKFLAASRAVAATG
jgi:hypothetical protein